MEIRTKQVTLTVPDSWSRADLEGESSTAVLVGPHAKWFDRTFCLIIRRLPCDYAHNLAEVNASMVNHVKEEKITALGPLKGHGIFKTGVHPDGSVFTYQLFFPDKPREGLVIMVLYFNGGEELSREELYAVLTSIKLN